MRANPRRRQGLPSGVLLAVFLLAAYVLPSAAHADTNTELGWGVKTSTTSHGTGRDNFAYTAAAGDRVEDALTITNHGATDLTLDIYAADGFTTDSGQLDVLPRADRSSFVGTWITPSATAVTLAPGQAQEVPFTLTIPPNATPGDYAGGIVTAVPQPQQAEGFTVDRRLGIRIQIRVDGELRPELTVTDPQITYHPTFNPATPGSATITYTVSNTGNTRFSATQGLTTSGPFGIARANAPAPEPIPELLPGDAWEVTATTAAVVPLFWISSDITLTASDPTEAGPTAVPAPVTLTATAAAIPWSQLVVLLLLTAIVILLVRRRRRRQRLDDARVTRAVEAALRAQKDDPTITQPTA